MRNVLVDEQVEQAVYIYALGLLRGIGSKSVLEITRAFPQIQRVPALSQEELTRGLGDPRLAKSIYTGLTTEWKDHFSHARRVIEQHLIKDIIPLPVTSDKYPILLKMIKDPPPLLYVKGDLTVLNNTTTLAIVGTREGTPHGLKAAHSIAYNAARHNCVIVSGLAKGTDTQAHRGAIEAGGKTIAVLATPLDKVYPAENKTLADEISLGAGLLVSECALGAGTNRGTFVARDRIQSGLSLGVFPIQTDINGGTMHTIRFAREQKRPLFYAPPPDEERSHEKYRGIFYLMEEAAKEKRADKTKRMINPFPPQHPGIYERLIERLEEQRQMLLVDHPVSPASSSLNVPLFVSPTDEDGKLGTSQSPTLIPPTERSEEKLQSSTMLIPVPSNSLQSQEAVHIAESISAREEQRATHRAENLQEELSGAAPTQFPASQATKQSDESRKKTTRTRKRSTTTKQTELTEGQDTQEQTKQHALEKASAPKARKGRSSQRKKPALKETQLEIEAFTSNSLEDDVSTHEQK